MTSSLTAGVRDLEKLDASLKKKIFGVLFRAPLFLGKWYGVATYFFIQKIRKTKYMTKLFSSLIE